MNPLLLVDSYKIHHTKMYPEGMTKLYSNFTPRKSRIEGVNEVVVFGIQHFVLKYLIDAFNDDFFGYIAEETGNQVRYIDKAEMIEEYKRHCPVDTTHIEALWDLGYLPIEIKALKEGTLCPIGVPMLTITNTHPDFGWLVNYLETLLSCMLWQCVTSATISHQYKKILTKYAKETDEKNLEFINWQGHDFSMRGMSSVESAILSGMGHLLSFTGTDTIPAIYQLENSYRAEGLIGASVPATEHSVMCMGTKDSEVGTFKRLLDLYPTGILSVVSDTWDLWKVCTEYLSELKEVILKRDGKLVIRPDSGDPVRIITGSYYWNGITGNGCTEYNSDKKGTVEGKGVIELLWEIFGGTVNEQGYKVLDPHIGAIYGDSITPDRAIQICERLKAKGFASTNIVLGIGSYTYQYNTRDTFGFAMKATYGELTHGCQYCEERHKLGKTCNVCDDNATTVEEREIFKDPITDDGTKKSKKGLLKVISRLDLSKVPKGMNVDDYIKTSPPHDGLVVLDQQTWDQEAGGQLETVFRDGILVRETNLNEIRERLSKSI